MVGDTEAALAGAAQVGAQLDHILVVPPLDLTPTTVHQNVPHLHPLRRHHLPHHPHPHLQRRLPQKVGEMKDSALHMEAGALAVDRAVVGVEKRQMWMNHQEKPQRTNNLISNKDGVQMRMSTAAIEAAAMPAHALLRSRSLNHMYHPIDGLNHR